MSSTPPTDEERAARNAAMGLDMDDELAQLLKEQEDFLKQSKRPAAKVMRAGKPAAFAAPSTAADADKPTDEKEEADAPQIVGSVMERDVIQLNIQNMNVMPRAQANGFPAVQRRGESLFGKRQRQPTSATAKPSRFSSAMKAGAPPGGVVERGVVEATAPVDPEQAEIDRTNNARLQEMSLDEIREAQQELMRSLDPTLLEKFMNKRKKAPAAVKKPAESAAKTRTNAAGTTVAIGKSVVTNNDEGEQKEEAASDQPPAAPIDLAKIKSEEQLFETAKLLPPEERAKHEWMQAVPDASASAAPSSATTKGDATKANARKEKLTATTERFDFNGDRIVSGGDGGVQHATHSGLFHHGDDPDAAGYTMSELIHLARSTVSSQRAMALTTITKILQKRIVYQQEQNLTNVFPRVLPTNLPITLRIALDDQNYTALSAAIAALHAFLVPPAELQQQNNEASAFEGAYGVVVAPPHIHLHRNIKEETTPASQEVLRLEIPPTEEVIYIDTSDVQDDEGNDVSSISDEDLTFLDPVQGFLNMDIGTRLRYILERIQLPDPTSTEKMLDILTQIANHSPKAAKDIGTNLKLMKALQQQCIENEAVLTLQDADEKEKNDAALRVTVKALALVRALCQGSRAVAAFLIGNGVIQSTKGFLAIQSSFTSPLFHDIQCESLRIWRVLLKYGLDFHCFAYLFPILCGFRGVDLVQKPTGEHDQDANSNRRRPARVTAALFAALEAFCGLESVHEAQHYFNQLGFFMNQAKDDILARMSTPEAQSKEDELMVIATAFRFLAATSALVSKHHLERKPILDVLEFTQQDAAFKSALVAIQERQHGPEVLAAIVHFHQQAVRRGILGDDMDDDDVARDFFQRTMLHQRNAVAKAMNALATAQSSNVHHVALTCSLLVSTCEMIVTNANDFYDDALVATMYAFGLKLMEQFVTGHEFWIHELLAKVLFDPVLLQKVGFFANKVDATTMSHVLIPIYQALVNTTREQEQHSQRNFAWQSSASSSLSPTEKSSCQLRVPQYEDAYVGSNLPLPGFWLFCPFSRMEFASSASSANDNGSPPSPAAPTRAENDEMKLIVSATCRFLYQLEIATTASTAWRQIEVSYQREMRDEDKLFHLLHVFFAGTDVLFDEHVDAALRQFLPKFALPVLKSKTSATLLYDGILRNLRRFQQLEDPNTTEKDAATAAAGLSFSSDEQLVMNFLEKLVAEFTSSSYGNVHFARCVTLFLARDFPVTIRKWIWKELQDCRLLHALQAFDDDKEATNATLMRLTNGGGKTATASDEQWIQLMKQALCQQQITPTRGVLAYCVAIHHLTMYLFNAPTPSTTKQQQEQPAAAAASMSFARQLLAQDLVRDASPAIWYHLLTYDDASTALSMVTTAVMACAAKQGRVDRIVNHAGLSPEQITAFHAKIAEDGEATA
uniref:RNA polymerase II-associated protein 1 N-terminal domain-containing protein n=1 Tax=Globisporangium ultimum (strain ATCC 200006 / CBS 805.95 / DAOM BR144) TaxID=431595 RepID=K3X1P0_GLOUD